MAKAYPIEGSVTENGKVFYTVLWNDSMTKPKRYSLETVKFIKSSKFCDELIAKTPAVTKTSSASKPAKASDLEARMTRIEALLAKALGV